MNLWDYQLSAFHQVNAAVAAGHRSVLLVAPTGAGKTTIARALIEAALALHRNVLFLAHRRELIAQCSERLAGIPHGIIQAGCDTTPAPVQVASIATLARRSELPPADLVIVDEAHRSPADGYRSLLARYPSAQTIGLTATPWRLDGRGLADLFSAIVVAASPAQLIAAGHLAPYAGFAYDAPVLHGTPRRAGDFASRGLELLMGAPKLAGNIVASWLAHASDLPTVVFACTRAHSRDLTARLQAAGVRAAHVDGGMSAGERDGIVARFRAGDLQLLTNCNILTEGFDLARLSCVVLARPTLSTALYIQQVGRALRPAPGKVARFHDHASVVATHGLPDADRDYSLTATVRGRLPNDDEMPALRTCAACFAIFPAAAVCPACGAAQAPRPRPLAEVQAEEIALAEAAARGRARDKQSTHVLAELAGTATAKGYKPGWTLVRFKQRFGRWPTRAERQAAAELADQKRGAA